MRVSCTLRVLPRLVFLMLIVALAGCSVFSKKVDPLDTLPVDQLYERGKTSIDRGNYDVAARTFQRLTSRFPFGAYSEQSQLDLAYAQYKMNKPDDAYSTANRFIKTYPTHKHVDYAYYLRGLINFDREEGLLERYVGLDMTTRDQSYLQQSFEDFGALIKRYPQSLYAADARQRMVHLRNGMAQSELNVALYYLRRGAYVGAVNRAQHVLETYDRTPQASDALAVMAESYKKLGQDALAQDSERVLKLNHPNHPYFSGDWPQWRSTFWKLVPLTNRGAKPTPSNTR